jgi:hypothetical protein
MTLGTRPSKEHGHDHRCKEESNRHDPRRRGGYVAAGEHGPIGVPEHVTERRVRPSRLGAHDRLLGTYEDHCGRAQHATHHADRPHPPLHGTSIAPHSRRSVTLPRNHRLRRSWSICRQNLRSSRRVGPLGGGSQGWAAVLGESGALCRRGVTQFAGPAIPRNHAWPRCRSGASARALVSSPIVADRIDPSHPAGGPTCRRARRSPRRSAWRGSPAFRRAPAG